MADQKVKLAVVDGETLMDMKLPPYKVLCRYLVTARDVYPWRCFQDRQIVVGA